METNIEILTKALLISFGVGQMNEWVLLTIIFAIQILSLRYAIHVWFLHTEVRSYTRLEIVLFGVIVVYTNLAILCLLLLLALDIAAYCFGPRD